MSGEKFSQGGGRGLIRRKVDGVEGGGGGEQAGEEAGAFKAEYLKRCYVPFSATLRVNVLHAQQQIR